jgi:RNA polymerase sigma-70 factor, ECF subfamily
LLQPVRVPFPGKPEFPGTTAPSGAGAPEDARAVVGKWYAAHGAALYGYLRFHLRSADEADELVAETFLRAVRAADRYRAELGEPRAWLFRIAGNALRDHRRRTRSGARLESRLSVSPAALRDLVSSAPSPDERLLWEEEVATLLAAVAELSERDRELIGLRFGSGMEMAEIAAVLGIREPAVRTRLWRALGRLRERMEADARR